MSLQSVSMGKRANPRNVILPKMSLAEINFTFGLQNVSMGKRANPRNVILPKMSLAEINSTLVYKTFRWEDQTGKSYYLK